MRIIKLNNQKIKEILKSKEAVVKEGRRLSAKIEEEARKIIDREAVVNGLKVNKGIYSGKYEELKKFFNFENQSAIETIIKGELSEDIAELDKLSGFINKYNGQVSRLIDKEKLEIGEFERPTKIELDKGQIIVEIEDVVEEYKKRYLEMKNKK